MATTFRNMMQEMQFGHLDKEVKNHLTRVYTCMGLALLACAAGSYLHLAGIFTAGLLTMIGVFAGVIGMGVMTRTPENEATRFGLMMGVGTLCGINQGPLLHLVIEINPSIVMTALLASSLVFICFSLASLLSEDRKWLALGGVLSSALSWLLLFGILNLFVKSTLIFELKLYIGLAVFCGFVLYDTQLIIEKCRDGDNDYIGHCLMLFLDFINIFRHILVLLTDKESSRDNNRRRRRD